MIDLSYIPLVSGGTAVVSGGDMLVVKEGANTYTQQLSGNYTGLVFHQSDDSGDDNAADAEAACSPRETPQS